VSGKVFTVVVLCLASALCAWADDADQGPKLLLSAQRLRRLKRDRERKTDRWVDFEKRVNTVPDSPERGFELALYYAITGDEARGREAVAWALSHDSLRQKALVVDWCGPLLSEDQKKKMLFYHFVINGQVSIEMTRNWWFNAVASGKGGENIPDEKSFNAQLATLVAGEYRNSDELYALCELIYTVRAVTRTDLREGDAHFFSTLPALLLLSAKPRELNSPNWKMHAAALALVEIDPNLPSSQFLQSWALEDNQTVHEGPGVGYELLWADPYLPGVGYQNMDSWIYDDHARLFARSSWEPNSCWISISAKGVEQENCPPNWKKQTVTFGRLTLIPMIDRCVEVPHVANNETVLVWQLQPEQKLGQGKGKDIRTTEADAAGIWRPGSNVEGRACVLPH
jgi:hypothetical protein